jgi:hypothetical protein
MMPPRSVSEEMSVYILSSSPFPFRLMYKYIFRVNILDLQLKISKKE